MEVKAPNDYEPRRKFTIFLAGAIDQGQAVDWQEKVARALDNYDVLVLNPRRDHWDAGLDQSINNPEFVKQVEWELRGQEESDLIVFVFTKDCKAPITFMEFGLFIRKHCLVCAEEGFYRTGNLDVVTKRYDIPMYHNLDDMIEAVQRELVSRDLHRTEQLNLKMS